MERLKTKKLINNAWFILYKDSNDNDLCDINDLIEFLEKAKKKGATHIQEGGSWYDFEIKPVKFEIESDVDFAKRLIEEKENRRKMKEDGEREERALFEALKIKYETKN